MKLINLFVPAVLATVLSACSDNKSSSEQAVVDDVVDSATELLLTELVDDIFLASENSEPVKVGELEIVDNADEYSFNYLLNNE